MRVYSGKSVFGGIAIGTIQVYKKGEQQVKRRKIEDVPAEIRRYRTAKQTALEQLQNLYDKALKEVGQANAAIFEIHQMMLEDDDYNESVENIIETQRVNAEYAVAVTEDNFAQMFASMEDEYMRGRAADVRDISERLVSVLSGNAGGGVQTEEPVIIAAQDLAPSETVQMDKQKVLSFVTIDGSMNSHTAILARTMGIPALVGASVPLDDTIDGRLGIVDGVSGVLYVEPDEETLAQMKEKQAQQEEQKRLLELLKGRENKTLDGKAIQLYANIGNSKDLAAVLQNDAGGIGLFRSEFIYLEREDFPTEEEQFAAYRQVAEMMAGKEVIIRTLDIGADKQADYFKLKKEENPAMGYRAIRICLTRPEIFRTQLRAIYRASAFGKISIMFPMIASLWEVQKAKEIAASVRDELKEQGVPFGNVAIGIMIETPAAAIISEDLAKEVDFFSIGTNDLVQYTLAIDRQNEKLDEFYDPKHPAVLRLIRFVAESGHKHGCMVGICGELGAETDLTEEFLKMGIDELSVSPSFLLKVREKIRQTDLTK